MTTDVPSPLVPKLRFPEFRVDTTWLAPQLADLYGFKRTNTLSRDNLNYEFGTIRNIHYGDIHTKFKPLFRLENEHVPYVNLDVAPDGFDDDAFCKEGDIVLADASEDLDDVGKAIEVVSLNGERVVSGTHTILATRRGSVPVVGFGGQLFQSTAVRTGIKREAQGAKIYGISANRISAIPVPVPPTEAEQQKIADCLGSLDDLVAAEGRKLEALRQHKQGLMQQLLPRPGETVPRLRFPDFQNAGAWEEETLDDLARRGTGHTPKKAIAEYYNGGIKWVSLADSKRLDNGLISETEIEISEEGINNSSAVLHPAGSVILSRDAGVGKSAIISCSMAVSQHFIVWTCEPSVLSNWFLYYQLQLLKPLFERIATGSTIKTIGLPFFNAMRVTVPRLAEQHRIADCLSMLDARLAAQVQKLDALKTHKQGLLQQLFPPLESQ